LNGDDFSGVTAMLMDEGLDTGDMLGFSYIDIKKDMIVGELFDKMAKTSTLYRLCIQCWHRIYQKTHTKKKLLSH
jgi:methionyl-tRNA formyltransferase